MERKCRGCQKAGRSPSRGSLGFGSEVGTLEGTHFDDFSDGVLDVLAYLLQRHVDVLGGIIALLTTAAFLRSE